MNDRVILNQAPAHGWGAKFPVSFPGVEKVDWVTPEGSPTASDDEGDVSTSNSASAEPLQWTPDQYSALNTEQGDFRLLQVEPQASFQDSVRCSLYKSRLDNCPPYFALSYVWGERANPMRISLNGRTSTVTGNLWTALQHFQSTSRPVTRNLWTALRHFRSTSGPVTLWVDALCINQDDAVEKSQQVRQMRRIYSGAKKT
jgi:hypothetical protein